MRGNNLVEDANHRDLTINAMFYNINLRQVEDPTGFGVSDLKRGLLRAANPDAAFMLRYDPLRAVRVMRFKACTRYAVDEYLKEALSQPALCEQFLVATKRDRIGQELKKAFDARNDVAGAVRLLAETRLFGAVLLGLGGDGLVLHRDMSEHATRRVDALQQLLASDSPTVFPSFLGLVLATCFWELRDSANSALRVKESDIYSTIVGALRLSHQDGEAAVVISRGANRFRELVNEPPSRLQLGLCLRFCGALWPSAWLLAVAADEDLGRRTLFERLRQQIDELRLDGVWAMKPLLNGNQIGKLLGIPPGPVFAVLTERLIEEQLKRPLLTQSEAEEFLFMIKNNL